MRSSLGFLGVGALAVAFAFGACNCPQPPGPDDGGEDGGPDAGLDAGPDAGPVDAGPDSGSGPTCIDLGNACSNAGGLPCCTGGICNGSSCVRPCADYGGGCSQGGQCCSGACGDAGTCTCKVIGAACGSPSECCTGVCNGTCQGLPGSSCKVTGLACGNDNECCSNNCNGGFCTAVFACQAYDDVCTFDGQCCSFQCNIPSGATAGRCNEPSGGCVGAGNPCTRSMDCCSRVCADFGAGNMACQPVIGCRPQGDNCTPTGDPQACCGSATCQGDNTCNNGTACRGAGMICGKPMTLLPDGGLGPCATTPGGTGCYSTNQETNCCESRKIGGDEYMCRVDVGGVPRCFGGQSAQCPNGYTGNPPCCIAGGDYCDFNDQCCNGLPCTVGADGGRQCVAATCKPLGSACTAGSNECCAGTDCLPSSEIGTVCQVPTDGGTTCSGNDAGCSTPATCCSGYCTTGHCGPPPACQPQGATCSSSADCCSNPPLSCVLSPGSTTGTCQPGSTCLKIGQACTSSSGCCSGLFCTDPLGVICTTDFNGCSCQVVIGSKGPEEP
ncbi:MAG TPA: hypothetical protein VIG99_15600 [Myxococcaceae bacterium]